MADARTSNVAAIQQYFTDPMPCLIPLGVTSERVRLSEFKALTSEERTELAQLARVELGIETSEVVKEN